MIVGLAYVRYVAPPLTGMIDVVGWRCNDVAGTVVDSSVVCTKIER
jgi:hypothetical protein